MTPPEDSLHWQLCGAVRRCIWHAPCWITELPAARGGAGAVLRLTADVDCRFHEECVSHFNSLHEGYFSHSTSHIYNAIITSYLKVWACEISSALSADALWQTQLFLIQRSHHPGYAQHIC